MGRPGPRKVQCYSLEFKRTAVGLSRQPGMQVQVVAAALEIHPFMLSRWRKEFREGRLKPSRRAPRPRPPRVAVVRELRRLQALEVAHRVLQEGHALLKKKGHQVLFRSKGDIFAFIDAKRGTWSVTRLCRRYGVTRAGFYAWRGRPVSAHRRQDAQLLTVMRPLFEASHGTYGSPRLHQALRQAGYAVSRRRVERLMRAAGWRARVVRVYGPKAGTHRWFGQHTNHVQRTRADRLNQIWVGDLTYLSVSGRWWYLAVVLDQCSRRVLAWRVGSVRDSRLTSAVLSAALRRRRPAPGLIFHTDRGSEFLGARVRQQLHQVHAHQSMTRGGATGENAHTWNRSSIP